MADVSALELIRGLYDYHWWANHRLLDHAASLGEEVAARDLGAQFSFPTIRRVLAHLYGADSIWLARWRGQPTSAIPGADIATLDELRHRWTETELDQRAFVGTLAPADLARIVEYRNTAGRTFRAALWPLLQHVPNHATHHRSEIATMITMTSGSPPDTGINTYVVAKSGQS